VHALVVMPGKLGGQGWNIEVPVPGLPPEKRRDHQAGEDGNRYHPAAARE
jgi:hypothetical protein